MKKNTIISGYYNNNNELNKISEYMHRISKNITTAHHIWINDIDDNIYKTIDNVRVSNYIYKKINEKFPNHIIKNVKEIDEIYYSASPKSAQNSDRSLVDCHYDGPFSVIPNFNIFFYRVIIACNENKTVLTNFPNNNIKVIMDKGEFHGLDYNKDLHCVEGKIPENKYRVLLKLHYILIPNNYNDNTFIEKTIRYINVYWTKKSREFMRISASPNNIQEKIFGQIVNITRVIYNNIYSFIFIIIIIVILFIINSKTSIIKKRNKLR
jgi:hypothetical protein